MKRVVVAVALVVLLSGCNAFGGAGGASGGTDSPAVSPAPVPTTQPTPTTPTDRPGTCLAPPPATPGPGTATTPAEPVALPGANATVNGSALVDYHAGTLADHRFHLRVANSTNVWAMPRAAAFTYEGFELGIKTSRAYAAGATLYTLDRSRDGHRVVRRPYEVGSPLNQRFVATLTGHDWLDNRIGRWEYEVVDTRTWNGADVRVLRDTLDRQILLGPDSPYNGLLDLNSTLYVDRRGVIRRAMHVRNLEIQTGVNEYENVTQVQTMRVPSVGSTRVFRPPDFCVDDPDSVAVGTPTDRAEERGPSATPTSPAPTGTGTGRGTAGPGHNGTGTAAGTAVATPTRTAANDAPRTVGNTTATD